MYLQLQQHCLFTDALSVLPLADRGMKKHCQNIGKKPKGRKGNNQKTLHSDVSREACPFHLHNEKGTVKTGSREEDSI